MPPRDAALRVERGAHSGRRSRLGIRRQLGLAEIEPVVARGAVAPKGMVEARLIGQLPVRARAVARLEQRLQVQRRAGHAQASVVVRLGAVRPLNAQQAQLCREQPREAPPLRLGRPIRHLCAAIGAPVALREPRRRPSQRLELQARLVDVRRAVQRCVQPDAEAPPGVLEQSRFVRLRPPCQVDVVHLGRNGADGARGGEDAIAVEGEATAVHVEGGEHVRRRREALEDDLDVAQGESGGEGDGRLAADAEDLSAGEVALHHPSHLLQLLQRLLRGDPHEEQVDVARGGKGRVRRICVCGRLERRRPPAVAFLGRCGSRVGLEVDAAHVLHLLAARRAPRLAACALHAGKHSAAGRDQAIPPKPAQQAAAEGVEVVEEMGEGRLEHRRPERRRLGGEEDLLGRQRRRL
mmetsp:Transcript_16937/g.54429  ORF Transcript_16937/g.54429 Transcript_16937/m.54429 type:complete len:409 (+) Transcript_16937:613-1839(+)